MELPPLLDRISDYVGWHAERRPEQDALVLGAERWSYARAAQEVDRLARALLAMGVRKGDRVALLSTPRPEWMLAFLANASIGGISVGLNPKFPPSELAYFVGDAQPRLLVGFGRDAEGDHVNELEALDREHDCIERTLILGDAPGATHTWRAWLAEGDGVGDARLAEARDAVATGDPLLIVYTSGTTGRPKGAVLPHRSLTRCSLVQAEHWPAEPLRSLNNLPVNHIGFVGDIGAHALVAGGTLFFMEKFDPPGILELISREGLTTWGQVPAMFQLTLAQPGFHGYDLSSLQWVIWGGSCAPRELIDSLSRTGARLATSYGMTETGGSVTYTDPAADLDTLAHTVGRPDPRYEVRIASPEGKPVGPGEEGEIQVRGDHLMLGYWGRPEATREAIDAEGWLHTGDVAELRPDGSYAIRGRLSEMFKSGGENVYPREVERVLEDHPGVALAAVFGVPDPVYDEVGHAYVVREPDSDPSAEELRSFCRERLVNFKVPRRVVVRDRLPMLPIGKVDKAALREESLGAGEGG